MADDPDFDPSLYARAPKFDVPSAVALSIKLLSATPQNAPPHVKKAAKTLHTKTITLQSVWKERDRVEKRSDPRPIDVRADGALGRFYRRIEDYAGLPHDKYPLAARADEILVTLFPSGLAFLKGTFPSQWAETQKRLERIDEEGLAEDIDKIAGPEFLAEIREIHQLYGEAIGITKAQPTFTIPSLAEPLRGVTSSMGLYLLQLVSVCLDEEASQEARTAARDALRPIDDHRASAARRDASKEPTDVVTPDTEVPEPPQ